MGASSIVLLGWPNQREPGLSAVCSSVRRYQELRVARISDSNGTPKAVNFLQGC